MNGINMSRQPLSTRNQRDGITLLFVLSMVVLFLLMGTTFVIVSNDYFRAAQRRSFVSSNVFDGEEFLDTAFYQLFRDVPLNDNSSQIRFHSILADQYGYGQKGQVQIDGAGTATHFANITIGANSTAPAAAGDSFRFFRYRVPGDIVTLHSDTGYFDGVLNGQVFSVTSGPLAGESRRIVSHTLSEGGTTADASDDTLIITVLRGDANWGLIEMGDNVVINGRDFGGVGFGDTTALNFAAYDTVATTERLGATEAINSPSHPLHVNQIGVPFSVDVAADRELGTDYANGTTETTAPADFVAGTGFVAIDGSPNEAYDAPDFQNMFLSGFDAAGNIIPSFHRDQLYMYMTSQLAANGITITPNELRAFTFRPVIMPDAMRDNLVREGSTANNDWVNRFTTPTGTTAPLTAAANTPASLDVDTDGDGIPDSVWIDIGLPTQTTSNGDTFRPLVAYRVIDMDGRLNVNAHGSTVDLALGVGTRRGSGYGVAEISLSGVASSYTNLIADLANNVTTDDPDDDERFTASQKLFGYELGGNTDVLGGFFSTGSNVLGQHIVQSVAAAPAEMPGFGTMTSLTTAQLVNPYTKDFSIGGGTGDSFYTAAELEPLLRPFDSDFGLLNSRLLATIAPANFNKVTTDSFSISTPSTAVPLSQRLLNILTTNGVAALATRRTMVADLLPRDILLGGKLDLNRPLGNGVDDDADSTVDEPDEAATAQMTTQRGTPTLNLDNGGTGTAGDGATGDALAKHRLVRDIYITILLACGDRAPVDSSGTPDFAVTTPTGAFPSDAPTETLTAADMEYRKMVAQWAVNIVDYRDPDSIMTAFEFDLEPFDSDGFEVDGDLSTTMYENPVGSGTFLPEEDVMVVWGVERPELLLTETFASHDRQTDDSPTADLTTDPAPNNDDDWDAVGIPVSNAVIEIYSPWFSSSTFYSPPAELANAAGTALDLDKTSATGSSPVWRIGLKERRSDENSDIVRSVYFTNPAGSTPTIDDTNIGAIDFYPSAAVPDVAPGSYVVAASSATLVAGQYTLTGGTGGVGGREVALGTTPPIIIDLPRPLSISDPNRGYVDNAMPPMPLAVPADQPLDTAARHRITYASDTSDGDFDAIWTYGVTEGFRYAYLQRLADPDLAFNATTNPYRTVDVLSIGLLAFNSADGTPDTWEMDESISEGGNVTMVNNDNDKYDPRSMQRGETFVSDAGAGRETARRNLFVTDEGDDAETPAAFPAAITSTFGAINSSMSGNTTPLGSLTWNNRPFASAAEVANVPYLSSDVLPYVFNSGLTITRATRANVPAPTNEVVRSYQTSFVPYFGDANHLHLPRLTAPLGTGTLTENRFTRLFDFVHVPSRYLGTETFIDSPYPVGLNASFYPPFNSVPSFREPGRININTIANIPGSTEVGDALFGGFGIAFGGTAGIQSLRDVSEGPSDIAGYFTSSEGRLFVPTIDGASELLPENGIGGAIFAPDAAGTAGLYDATSTAIQDSAGTAYFRNEFRQRLGGMVTTKSSVFSIWITIGYFEVDEFGRLGAEVGAAENNVTRNRAFYMVDRSIPVAFEPGRNHNVDDAVLLRSIIE